MTTRQAYAAGTLYENDTQRLLAQVESWLEASPFKPKETPVKAIIAPHSCFFASGQTAAAAYRQLEPQYDQIKRVVIVGTAHNEKTDQIMLPEVTHFSSPHGKIAVDQAQISQLLNFDQIVINDDWHTTEHSIEMQLPFLQTLLEDFTLVPLVTNQCNYQYLAEALSSVWGGPETLIVISSGLSRHLPLKQAIVQDTRTAEKILARDNSIEEPYACAFSAINALLSCAKKYQLLPDQVALTTSAKATGNTDKVRGFGAFAFYEQG